jgi:integrase
MATLDTEAGKKGATWRIRFVDHAGRRQTIRLGKISRRIAETAKVRIEALLAAKVAGHSIDKETAEWLSAISDVIHARLAKVGLVEPRVAVDQPEFEVVGIQSHVERYIGSRSKLKPNTRRNYETTKRILVEHFGGDRPLRSITAGHARDYREWLVAKYAQATVAREIKRSRQFFDYARDCRLIEENPFAKVPAGSQKNTKRKHYVAHDVIQKVLEACPDNEWRLIVALARYGGLRIPSELVDLTWDRIDWEAGRFTVVVKKKEHLDGHETRVVPIFPELRPYLEKAFDEAPAGSVYVVPRGRSGAVNLRTGLQRILRRASVAQWPKLFVNLRASRETELVLEHPEHVVRAWIGNSEKVAADHYLMVTEDDFSRASKNPAHIPAQSEPDMGRQEPTTLSETAVKLADHENHGRSRYPHGESSDPQNSASCAASGNSGPDSGPVEVGSDLLELLRLLAGLTPEERRGLLDLAREAAGRRSSS